MHLHSSQAMTCHTNEHMGTYKHTDSQPDMSRCSNTINRITFVLVHPKIILCRCHDDDKFRDWIKDMKNLNTEYNFEWIEFVWMNFFYFQNLTNNRRKTRKGKNGNCEINIIVSYILLLLLLLLIILLFFFSFSLILLFPLPLLLLLDVVQLRRR